jgi:hypothetical protein
MNCLVSFFLCLLFVLFVFLFMDVFTFTLDTLPTEVLYHLVSFLDALLFSVPYD